MMKTLPNNAVRLSESQILQLSQQGCFSTDWDKISVSEETDLRLIRNVRFYGNVSIGRLKFSSEREEGVFNSVIKDCNIGDNVYISSVGGELNGCDIGNRVIIENVGRVCFEREAACGQGIAVNVLDETGSRPVYIYPGMNAQIAALMMLRPKWTDDVLHPIIRDYCLLYPRSTSIGDNCIIKDTVCLVNVSVDPGIKIEGAKHLKNGSLVNNNTTEGECLTYVGIGVDAENFIVEDAEISTGAILRNVYVGQGCALVKGFTAHDSLFFANSVCENGEACAVFAGPYTVSMHKSTLLIGGMYSFMNAGSGTNFSNHKYKLGPLHCGIMQRGTKTASNSYFMWGGKIGAFSLLIGSHKTHPDTSIFPFSYLIGNEKGETIVVPAIMLKSCGMKRDSVKWPARDKRESYNLPKKDNVCFEIFNPVTVGLMIKAVELLMQIETYETDEFGFVRYEGMLLKASGVSRAIDLYKTAIVKYMLEKTSGVDVSKIEPAGVEWIDLAGQIIKKDELEKIYQSDSIDEIEKILTEAYDGYAQDELKWIAHKLQSGWDAEITAIGRNTEELNRLIEDDRKKSREALSRENNLLSL